MRRLRTVIVILLLLAGIAALWQPAYSYWQKQNAPKWKTAAMAKGDVTAVVNATGTIKPVLQISVGAFVSGPIEKLHVEFNDEVKDKQLMAEIDPRIYVAAVARDKAALANREAEVERAKAQLTQAERDEARAMNLREDNKAFIAQAEIDRVHFARKALEAQVKVAETAVLQAKASLQNSELSLEYTKIRAPCDGIVINRKIDPGQTLAAQFQTPELFIVAPDMRKKMYVHAAVDEADIGLIKIAKDKQLPVTFTVDAYQEDLFSGVVEEIRLSSTTTQNVVTYPVIVSAENHDLKLLPGMTANLSFEVAHSSDVLKIPNSALRYFPLKQHVREKDHALLEGKSDTENADPTEVQNSGLSAAERNEARKSRRIRHVWVADGLKLKAVEVIVGLTESRYTEMVSGDLKVGDLLVTGIEPPKAWGG